MVRGDRLAAVLTAAATVAVWPPSVAHAQPSVTYEVVSASIGAADIQYFDGTRRQALFNVPLPWRLTVPVANPTSLGSDVAEVRADWRWAAAPNRWVTARIHIGETTRCSNTLDVGNVACYGATPFDNSERPVVSDLSTGGPVPISTEGPV